MTSHYALTFCPVSVITEYSLRCRNKPASHIKKNLNVIAIFLIPEKYRGKLSMKKIMILFLAVGMLSFFVAANADSKAIFPSDYRITNEQCLTINFENLNLDIPCAFYLGTCYSFTLNYAPELGFAWFLDLTTLTSHEQTPEHNGKEIIINPENLNIDALCIYFFDMCYSFKLNYAPELGLGLGWRLDLESVASCGHEEPEGSVKKEYINPFIESTLKSLEMMAQITAIQGDIVIKQELSTSYDISAIVRLSGEVEGSIIVSMSKNVACHVSSNLLMEEITELNDDAQDAIGEMGNIIVGDARRALVAMGKNVTISLPEIILGKGHVVASEGASYLSIPFSTEFGPFDVIVALREDR